MTIINESLELYDDNGNKLTRSQIAALVDNLESKYGRPYCVYIATDEKKQWLKVGISETPTARKYTLKDETVGTVEMVYWVTVHDKADALRLERSMHMFLTMLGRGPVYKNEWFTLIERDFRLIQYLMLTTPLIVLESMFRTLAGVYPSWLKDSLTAFDYVIEEVGLIAGNLVQDHFKQEAGRK